MAIYIKTLVIFVLFSIATVLIFITSAPYKANSQSNPLVMKISPTKFDLTLKPGESKEVSFTLTNINAATLNIKPAIYDFKAGDDGQPVVLFDGKDKNFGIKDWVKPMSKFSISPGDTKTFTTTVTAPLNAKDQTYFGTVVFTAEGNPSETQKAVGSLLFIDIGNPVYSGQITDIKATPGEVEVKNKFSTSTKKVTDINIQFRNDGEYRFTPNFLLEVYDSSGNSVEAVDTEITASSLPQSVRLFSYQYDKSLNGRHKFIVTAKYPNGELAGDRLIKEINVGADSDITDNNQSEDRSTVEEDAKENHSIIVLIAVLAITIFMIVSISGLVIHKRKKNNKNSMSPQVLDQTLANQPVDNIIQPSSNLSSSNKDNNQSLDK